MSVIFSQCQEKANSPESIQPEPLKFRFLKGISLFNPILRSFLLPHRQNDYKFSKQYLQFLAYEENKSIPLVYFPARDPASSMILIYCHGSGSTLNNVYGFGSNLTYKYGIAVALFDYTGEGESIGQFISYENDINIMTSWAIKQGYNPFRIILCGFSIGSYPALSVLGPMPRILISPVCGLIPFIEGTCLQYQGQPFDNINKAEKLKCRSLVIHCKQQMVPLSHSHRIIEALQVNNSTSEIEFYEIDGYEHNTAPSFLISEDSTKIFRNFLKKVNEQSKRGRQLSNQEEHSLDCLKKLGDKIVAFKKIERNDSPDQ